MQRFSYSVQTTSRGRNDLAPNVSYVCIKVCARDINYVENFKKSTLILAKQKTEIGFEFLQINSLNDFDNSCIYQSFTAV